MNKSFLWIPIIAIALIGNPGEDRLAIASVASTMAVEQMFDKKNDIFYQECLDFNKEDYGKLFPKGSKI